MRIEIQDGKVDIRGGTIKQGDRAGQAWEIRQQTGYMYNGGAYPEKITLTLPRDHAGYAPGFYTLAPESFVRGDFSVPQLAKVVTLVREVEAAKLARAG
jgi:hypothetical protein